MTPFLPPVGEMENFYIRLIWNFVGVIVFLEHKLAVNGYRDEAVAVFHPVQDIPYCHTLVPFDLVSVVDQQHVF